MVVANRSVLYLVTLECAAAALAISSPAMEHHALTLTNVPAMEARETVNMLAPTPPALEYAAAQLATSCLQMEYLVKVSIKKKLISVATLHQVPSLGSLPISFSTLHTQKSYRDQSITSVVNCII